MQLVLGRMQTSQISLKLEIANQMTSAARNQSQSRNRNRRATGSAAIRGIHKKVVFKGKEGELVLTDQVLFFRTAPGQKDYQWRWQDFSRKPKLHSQHPFVKLTNSQDPTKCVVFQLSSHAEKAKLRDDIANCLNNEVRNEEEKEDEEEEEANIEQQVETPNEHPKDNAPEEDSSSKPLLISAKAVNYQQPEEEPAPINNAKEKAASNIYNPPKVLANNRGVLLVQAVLLVLLVEGILAFRVATSYWNMTRREILDPRGNKNNAMEGSADLDVIHKVTEGDRTLKDSKEETLALDKGWSEGIGWCNASSQFVTEVEERQPLKKASNSTEEMCWLEENNFCSSDNISSHGYELDATHKITEEAASTLDDSKERVPALGCSWSEGMEWQNASSGLVTKDEERQPLNNASNIAEGMCWLEETKFCALAVTVDESNPKCWQGSCLGKDGQVVEWLLE